MNVPCRLIEDLLPLYHDEICSQESRELVEAHVRGCPACQQSLKAMEEGLDHPQEDEEEASALKAAQAGWKKWRKIFLCKGGLIAILVVLIAASPLWLTLRQNTPVPAEEIEISQLCQLEDGTIVFHLYIKDGKTLEKIVFYVDQDGSLYYTPMHALWEANRTSEQGLFNIYLAFGNTGRVEGEPPNKTALLLEDIPAIYAGTPEDRVLIWKPGMDLPKASQNMETMMDHYINPLESSSSFWSEEDWQDYYAMLEGTLGNEMMRKEALS